MCALSSAPRDITYNTHFINSVPFRQLIEYGVHAVQHRNDFHGCNSAANFGERDDVREQDGDRVEHLETISRQYVNVRSSKQFYI